jgi:hypothetical protein
MMNTDFEDELDNLLNKYYGKDWFFNWTGEDGGFQLILNVYNQPQEDD